MPMAVLMQDPFPTIQRRSARALAVSRPSALLGSSYGESLRLTVPDGEPGTWATVDAMRAMVDDAVMFSPLVQRIASAIVASAPRRDQPQQAVELWNFIRRSIVFKKDTWRTEHLRHPDQLLTEIAQQGRTAADCDCVAMLGAALLRSMGMPAFFVLASKRDDQVLEHIFFATKIRGAMVPLDPQENLPPGAWPATTRRVVVEA